MKCNLCECCEKLCQSLRVFISTKSRGNMYWGTLCHIVVQHRTTHIHTDCKCDCKDNSQCYGIRCNKGRCIYRHDWQVSIYCSYAVYLYKHCKVALWIPCKILWSSLYFDSGTYQLKDSPLTLYQNCIKLPKGQRGKSFYLKWQSLKCSVWVIYDQL